VVAPWVYPGILGYIIRALLCVKGDTMAGNRDSSAGISLRDVQDCLREIQSAHCCNCTITLSMPVNSGTSVMFWVKVQAEPRIVAKRTLRGPVAVSSRWPHVDHKTLAGLMFSLCHKLDRDLDEHGHVPAEQATFDLR
jgi:hypothetical protein